jgi:hypothetical protein
MLILPGLLWFAAREAGRPSPVDFRSLCALLMMALGLWIKPFFILVLGVLVAVRAANSRNWRMLFGVESIVLLLVGLIYVALIYAFFRDSFSSAALAAKVYSAYEISWWSTLMAFKRDLLEFAVLVVAVEIAPMSPQRRIFLRQLLLAAAMFLAVAILQRKGWSNHVFPTEELMFLLVGLLGLELFGRFRRDGTASKAVLASSLAVICVGAVFLKHITLEYWAAREQRESFLASPFLKTVDELAAGEPWVALTTGVIPSFPTTLLVNNQWSSRSPHQWLIPGIVKLNSAGAQGREKAEELRGLATRFVNEDLERYRPVLVAVALGEQQGVGKPFDFLEFFSENEDFRRAWAPYRLVKTIEGWNFYMRTD